MVVAFLPFGIRTCRDTGRRRVVTDLSQPRKRDAPEGFSEISLGILRGGGCGERI
jgi:hypothetical protein